MSNDTLELLLDGLAVLLVQTLLVDCLLSLTDTGCDGWDAGEQSNREEEVGGAGGICGDREGAGDEGGKGRGEGVGDVEANGEGDEGDWGVDERWVDGLLERILGLAVFVLALRRRK